MRTLFADSDLYNLMIEWYKAYPVHDVALQKVTTILKETLDYVKEDDEEENPEADEVLIYLLFSTSLINTLISIGRDSQGGNRTSR